MTKKRIGTMAACLALVGAVAVGGTLALLSSYSNVVTNTFTAGEGYNSDPAKVVTLHESPVVQGIDGGYTVTSGEDNYDGIAYDKLVSNTTVAKDPTVTVKKNTMDSWVVAYIDNVDELFNNSKFNTTDDWYIVSDTDGDGTWTLGTTINNQNLTEGYLIYKSVVTENAADQDLTPLFTTLNVGEVTPGEKYADMSIKAGVVQYTSGKTDVSKLSAEELSVIMNFAKAGVSSISDTGDGE